MQATGIFPSSISNSSTFHFLTKIGIGALLLGCCAVPSLAQDLPDVAQGLQPYVGYHGGELDTVSMLNGGLTVRIPLVSYPQKGSLALSYSVVFNSFSFQDLAQCNAADAPDGPIATIPLNNGCTNNMRLVSTGLPSNFPLSPRLIADQQLWSGGSSAPEQVQLAQPPVDGRFYVIGADNAQHPLGAASDGYRSIDESGYFFAPTSAPAFGTNLGGMEGAYAGDTTRVMGYAPGTITDVHGLVYSTSGTITDPDGNSLSLNPSTGGLYSGLPATDSTGRSIPAPTAADTGQCPTLPNAQFQSVTSALLWTPPGSGSGYLFCYASVNIYTHMVIGSTSRGNHQFSQTVTMLQSIVLPNGTYWGFIYDSNNPSYTGQGNTTVGLGQLMTLIYPTGGSVSYTYSQSSGFCNSQRQSGLVPASMLPFILQVATRTMTDAQGDVSTWTYNYPPNIYTGAFTGSILSPEGDLTVTYFAANGTDCGYVDAGQDVYQGSSTSGPLLKSTRTTYSTLGAPGMPEASAARAAQVTTTLNDGSTSSVLTSYSSGINFSVTQCDYTGANCAPAGSFALPIGGATSTSYTGFDGTVIKTENTTYAWPGNSAYFTANLLDLPAQTSTLDGSGNTIETTNYSYDESTYAPGETTVRGHLTTVAKSLNMASGPAPTVHTGWNTSGTAAGEKAYSIDANNNTTSYSYGACNGSVVTGTTNALGQSVSGSYDCNTGLLTSLTDLNSNTTSVSWDAMRRITQVTYPPISTGTPTTSFNYADSTNTVTKTVAASPDPSQTTTVTFDGFGREITRIGSDASGGASVNTGYDADGRVASVTNPYHSGDTVYSTATTYDALGRALVVTKPDGNTTTTSYTGPTTDSWDENGTHMQHTTDALGRLVKVMELGTSADPRSLETDYTYNALDDLLSVNQHGASGETPRMRSFTYDSLSRLITSTNPETGTICYGVWNGGSCQNGYDANSNLVNKTDATGDLTTNTYDALNRITTAFSSDLWQTSREFFYDFCGFCENAIGRMTFQTEMQSNVGDGYSYDAMGNVIQTIHSDSRNAGALLTGFSASHDLAGNPTSITYPSGRVVNNSYDAAGRLTSVTDATPGGTGTVYFSGGVYTAAGALGSASYGNGVTENLQYNSRLQPCHTTAANSGGGTIYDRASFYGPATISVGPGITLVNNFTTCGNDLRNNGNISAIVDNVNTGWTQSFTYDGLNRLNTAARSDGGYNHTYNIDSFGNLIVQDNLNGNPTYTINSATNQLNRWNGPVNEYGYDAAGNLISSGTSDIGGHTFDYNAYNQIVDVDSWTSGVYIYDGLGQRAGKRVGSNATEYYYLNGQPMEEQDWSGTPTDYIYANGQKIAKLTSTGTLNYYLDDHLGTTQVELDTSGNVTWQGQFTPFGAELDSGTTTMHYKFTGKERDAESGLDFFGARYYASTMGRWLSPDWAQKPEAVPYSQLADPQSLNLYGYVGNNPLSKADADGHCCQAAVDFFSGWAGSYGSDETAGISPRSAPDSNAGRTGAAFGDLHAFVQGGLETAVGIAGEIGGVDLDSSGGGAIIGVPVNIASAVVGVHGVVSSTVAARSLLKTGSYTNTHASGTKYHGKGDEQRAAESGRRIAKEEKDPLVSTDHTPAKNDREAFKQESRRLQKDGGPKSSNNYNKIDSPGTKYRKQDGTP